MRGGDNTTTAVLDHAITGSATGTTRSNLTVSGGKTFNGPSGLIEFFQEQTTTYTAPASAGIGRHHADPVAVLFQRKRLCHLRLRGTVAASVPLLGTTLTTNITYNPARAGRRYTLAVGASDTTSSGTNTEWAGKTSGAPLKSTSRALDGTAIVLSPTAASRHNGAPL